MPTITTEHIQCKPTLFVFTGEIC